MSHEGPLLSFDPLCDPPGVEVVDRVERLRYRLHTPEPVSPAPVETDGFLFPVDSAVRFGTDALVLPAGKSVCVRDRSGEMITEVDHLDEQSVGEGAYVLELGAQIKTYVRVEGPVTVAVGLAETRISLDREQAVELGVVSWHDRPAATITTTTDPVDMMDAVSTFGSALKTTSPERSFPSNRGHPPAVELGTALEIPETLQPPGTGIRIEIPPAYGAIYVVAPLAYYLGAEVVPGPTPRLVTEAGFEHRLDSPGGLERGVRRTLERTFLLDCATRTEGVYNIELRERNELEGRVDLDWAGLYDRPVAERVERYLDVPYSTVEESVPEWRLTVHVEADAETVEGIPFVVDDLAVVRTADTPSAGTPAPQPAPAATLSRDEVITRAAAASGGGEATYVEPQSGSSLEQAWIGDRIPIGASKLTMDAFHNRLDREAGAGDISITVVLNDARMEAERDAADRVYGDREDLPFDVTFCRDLTVSELRAQLARDRNFLHYIGHTEHDGFGCADGKLDASTLETVGFDSFLLNACNSYHQGLGLIEAGAIGGIVTLNDVANDGAVRIGGTIARLLNAGFPLRAALTIAREESVLGGQYIVVGDGGMTVTQAPSRTPNLLNVSPVGDGYAVDIETYATDDAGLGTIYKPHIDGNDEYFLNSGSIATFHLSGEELATFFELENVPVRVGGELHWSFSLDPGDLE
jgi:hypothetical protein